MLKVNQINGNFHLKSLAHLDAVDIHISNTLQMINVVVSNDWMT